MLLVLPVPFVVMDMLLALSIASSLLIMLVVIYVRQPVEFSAFPTVLLGLTLFRLALNICSTRLVLTRGEAGHIIDAFGKIVIQGNYVVGFVVFVILVVINFVVITKHLKKLCPPSCKLTVEAGHAGEAYLVQPDSPRAQAALRALREAFGCEPVIMREGGSIPIVNDFKRILGVETLLLGLSLPDDNAHSPNEKFDLDCFSSGMRMSALLWRELAGVK